MGGLGHDGETHRSFDEVWQLDGAKGEWSALEVHLPRPITQFRALVREKELWLFGGMDFDPRRDESMQLENRVLRANLADLAAGFSEVSRLPSDRRAFGAALLDGKAYVAGGLDGDFEAIASFAALDLATLKWSELPAPEQARISPELVALGGKLYLCGGSILVDGKAKPYPALEEFDPASGAWRTLMESLPLDAYELQAFEWRGRLALFSSQTEGMLRIALLDPLALE